MVSKLVHPWLVLSSDSGKIGNQTSLTCFLLLAMNRQKVDDAVILSMLANAKVVPVSKHAPSNNYTEANATVVAQQASVAPNSAAVAPPVIYNTPPVYYSRPVYTPSFNYGYNYNYNYNYPYNYWPHR